MKLLLPNDSIAICYSLLLIRELARALVKSIIWTSCVQVHYRIMTVFRLIQTLL